MELEDPEEVATNRAKELGPFIAKRHKSGSTYDEIAVQMNKTKIPAPRRTEDDPDFIEAIKASKAA